MKKLAIISSFPAFILAARFVPFDRLPRMCVFLGLTGYPCPLCGMTRSVMALVRLHFLTSVHFNVLGSVAVLVAGVCWLAASYQALTGRQTRLAQMASRRHIFLIFAGLGTLLTVGAARIWLLAR